MGKKLSHGVRKFIREEKGRIRETFIDSVERNRKLEELSDRFGLRKPIREDSRSFANS